MKLILTMLVVGMVASFDAFMLFGVWFTFSFFGAGPSSWVVSFVAIVPGAIVTWAGGRALARVRHGNYAV